MNRRTVLLHGEGADLPVAVDRLQRDGAQLDFLTKRPTSMARDLAERGLITLVDDVDPFSYDEVIRLTGRTAASGDQTRLPATPEPANCASRTTPGRVIIVGGGPGDPGLITVDGLAALYAADVVVCDRLAPLSLLNELPAAEIIHVGKIPHGDFTPQESINALLIRAAHEGHTVVRLKGGDGYVLGRGGEEYLACRQAGVDVSVVPGVTSAISVPALAGIPVTHRGMTQGFVVVSGHVPPDDPRCSTDWSVLARCGLTLVVLMGIGNLRRIVDKLMLDGLPRDTPAAIIERGASPQARTIQAILETICAEAERANAGMPAIIVIGSVVNVFTDSVPE